MCCLQRTGEITYNGADLKEFIPERTSACEPLLLHAGLQASVQLSACGRVPSVVSLPAKLAAASIAAVAALHEADCEGLCADVTQYDEHMAELTVRETVDFARRVQGAGAYGGEQSHQCCLSCHALASQACPKMHLLL